MHHPLRILLAAAACLLTLSACSLFVPSHQPLAVTASEPDADIYVDGALVGKGAVTIDVRRNKSHAIMARVGNRTGVANVGTSISTTGVLDVVGGVLFLFPFIGIAGPGFFSLDPDTVTVIIPPASDN